MLRIVSMPGPSPTSCRVCRRRRKKCDMTKPCCDRCAKDGYECLGYEEDKPRVRLCRDYPDAPTVPYQRPVYTSVSTNESTEELPHRLSNARSEDLRDLTGASADGSRPSTPGITKLYQARDQRLTKEKDMAVCGGLLRDFDRLWPQDPSQLVLYSRSRTRQFTFTKRTSSMKPSGSDSTGFIESISQPLYPSIDAMQIGREDRLSRVANEYIFQRLGLWFVPPAPTACDVFAESLRGATRTVQVLYFGAWVLRKLGHNLGIRSFASKGCVSWINGFEQKITASSRSNALPNEIGDCVAAHIEISYTALRSVLPKLLRLVATDPCLMIQEPDGNLVISLPRMLYALRPELHENFGYEWVHGIPAVLLQVIAQVNSWRAGSRVPLDHWQALEQRVLSWTSRYAMLNDSAIAESATCLRAAVQEGWKHVVNIGIARVYAGFHHTTRGCKRR
ncbi:fungal zn(2)-Cys(6) binuclear cluster domain-containing protein [Rhizoctonia solani AG-1 IA]|uniref:Fungal zn(2)-Cys(6) binuclear cluster domain-containing protein n=1 Tax=Thanatephorus cucumeris (strain AG1-IA) TaxID=983506 RepID=L8WHI8_THACA|nr:fungal zn(2)-Cys(6) binuclear cluster domain-containing protein [Rhizoctonia solani AG-1 IA]